MAPPRCWSWRPSRAKTLGLTPLARFVTYQTAGVEPERFGIGPVPAIRKALKAAGLTLDDIGLVELNEAFAAQVLACLAELPIDPDKLNVNGGAIALGHPLGCTGAKLTTTLLLRDAAPGRALRPGDDVRRRWHGGGGDFRADVVTGYELRVTSRVQGDGFRVTSFRSDP